jgi:hypothetical protein
LPRVQLGPTTHRPSPLVLRWAKSFPQWGIQRILDLGAGNLRNSLYLADLGFSLWAADLPAQLARLGANLPPVPLLDTRLLQRTRLNMDLVLCTYVINILPPKEQSSLLALARRNLKRGGYLCLEVRRKNNSASLNALTPSELAAVVEPWGFRPAALEEGPAWLGMLFYCGRKMNIE